MKVIHVIDDLRSGGAQRLLETLATATAFEIAVLSSAHADLRPALRSHGIPIADCRTNGLTSVPSWLRVFQALRKSEADVAHLHLAYATIMGAPLAKLLGKRVVVSLHETPPPLDGQFRKRIKAWLETQCLKHFTDLIIAVGEEVRSTNGLRAGRTPMLVLRNTIAPAVPSDHERRAALRRRYGLPPPGECILVLAVGRLTRQKDQLTLVRSIAPLVRRFNARLLVAGDGEERPALENAIHALGLGSEVMLLGNRDDVFELMECADIFVQSSMWEGVPLALMEAMARGLPPIATRVGGVPSVVGDAGILVSPGDVAELRQALETLCFDQAKRAELGRRAAEAAREFTNVERWIERLHGAYQQVR